MEFNQNERGVSGRAESFDATGNASFISTLSPFYLEFEREAAKLGLDDVGAAPVADAKTFSIFSERVKMGYCADMSYMTENVEARRSPTSVMADAQTIVVAALSESRLRDESREATAALFSAPELQTRDGASEDGAIVGYATCLDYHDALRKRLKALARFILANFPGAKVRVAVDAAPLLEKDWAVAAGLGFCGLNTLTISPKLGSRFFLGEALVSIPFEEFVGLKTPEEYLSARRAARVARGEPTFDAQTEARKCLACRRCVDACPTDALPGDRTLDARRCLNYWTIENRGEIPDDIGKALAGRLFGCDLCQRVCPRNARIDAAAPRELPLDAVERLDEATFRRLFKKTPIFRAHVEGLRRVARKLRRSDDEGTPS